MSPTVAVTEDRAVPTSAEPTRPAAGRGSSSNLTSVIAAWTVLWLFALLLKSGLGPALRGAFVGAGTWIRLVEDVGSFFSQAAAVCGSTLLIILGLASFRLDTQIGTRILTLLFAFLPTTILFLAQRTVLPTFLIGVGTLSASLTLLLGSQHSSVPRAQRLVFILCAGTALFAATAELVQSPQFAQALGLMSRVCAFFSIGLALLLGRRGPFALAAVLGLALLLAVASIQPTSIHILPVFLTARSMLAMSLAGDSLWTAFEFSLALLLVLTRFARCFSSPTEYLALVMVLATHSPLTPLTGSVIALGGFLVSFIYGLDSPQAASTRQPQLIQR